MKKFYILLITLFTFLAAAQAQVIVYHENFNNNISGLTATNFIITNTAPYSDTLYTAGNYAQTSTTASGQQVLVINNSISTYNLKDIRITWKEYRTQYHRRSNGIIVTSPSGNTTFVANTNPVKLEYSLDGVNYVQVTGFTQNTSNFFSWGAVNNGAPVALPFAVNNRPNVRLRWTINVNNVNTDYYAMDDVMINGTPVTGTSTFRWSTRPVNEKPFTASSATSVNPYTVDGVTMRWTRSNIGTGTTVETDAVSTTFLNRNTLTLIQSGAAAAAGTQVTMQLGKRVSGLTFTLYDVDRNAGQFLDKIQVIGYDGATAIPLTKNMMLPTVSNEFSNGAARAKVDGVDSKVTSNKGNVTISFVANIDRVELRYFNDDAAKGRQGIGISDISWAMAEESITAMPVELASFKGQLKNGQSVLTWVTAMEKDNDKFLIERSQDGKTFTKIGEVKGNGNSNRTINYTFTDVKPVVGFNYYRLQQVDYNGTTSFSAIVAIELTNKVAGIAAKPVLYPTVATDVINISLTGFGTKVNLTVLDASGRLVKQMTTTSGAEAEVSVQNLKGGAYFVSLSDGQRHETLRFLKQ